MRAPLIYVAKSDAEASKHGYTSIIHDNEAETVDSKSINATEFHGNVLGKACTK